MPPNFQTTISEEVTVFGCSKILGVTTMLTLKLAVLGHLRPRVDGGQIYFRRAEAERLRETLVAVKTARGEA